jgi:hypothetical protein
MPTGQPDFYDLSPSDVETHVDRIIREAMEAGEFDSLPGEGTPIPGAGSVDDEMWWVRSWLKRNRSEGDQPASSSS